MGEMNEGDPLMMEERGEVYKEGMRENSFGSADMKFKSIFNQFRVKVQDGVLDRGI